VLDRHDAIARDLAEAPARYAPLFMRTDEGIVLAQDWAAGFLAAVAGHAGRSNEGSSLRRSHRPFRRQRQNR
jgi:hypothetical protein